MKQGYAIGLQIFQKVKKKMKERKKDHPVFVVREDIVGQGSRARDHFNFLELPDSTLNRFFEVFLKICELEDDDSCQIRLGGFLKFFRLQDEEGMPLTFAKHAFSILDRDKSGELDFCEFVTCIWNYCTFSAIGLINFAFDLYDTNDSGE
jgi:Ca2+-binding EF-hand superfamily protein